MRAQRGRAEVTEKKIDILGWGTVVEICKWGGGKRGLTTSARGGQGGHRGKTIFTAPACPVGRKTQRTQRKATDIDRINPPSTKQLGGQGGGQAGLESRKLPQNYI